MSRKSSTSNKGVTRRTATRSLGAVVLAGIAPFNIAARQGRAEVGMLLPRSGMQAGIGQDCQRGVDIAPGILKELGPAGARDHECRHGNKGGSRPFPRREAHQRCAQVLVGAFDSGQSTAIAQVAEQKAFPTSSTSPRAADHRAGYKFVFRNFPTAGMILSDAFANQKELFEQAGAAPKTVVFMHINDTFERR